MTDDIQEQLDIIKENIHVLAHGMESLHHSYQVFKSCMENLVVSMDIMTSVTMKLNKERRKNND